MHGDLEGQLDRGKIAVPLVVNLHSPNFWCFTTNNTLA